MVDRKFFDTEQRGDWQLNACMAFKPGDAYPYIYGYKQAADRLIMDIALGSQIIGDKPTIDLIVYPICFLYRHYLEIHLKSLIEDCGKLYDLDEVKVYLGKSNHSLNDLWLKFKSILDKHDSDDVAYFDEYDAIVEELNAFDERSTTFRYSRDLKSRDISLSHKDSGVPVQHCALDNLYNEMQKLHDTLAGVDAYLAEQYGWKMESLRDCY